ncbi:YihY/virulence factor BrkB family protein [Microbacterium sp. C7(2022)]|uniref:YihY/virulence factor BrkB family protein n=1 Tax=Microbacterium sp. C7(2022) TaxID=2992759 RepID=UPI00237C4306|nr:YihY/virulence factor BrkB family protein [Microbacterium sp. C7(2022)]MDE0546721.1 YihY/virulence factor BrkB family protein [Microbacterium sp. C7(2022)]
MKEFVAKAIRWVLTLKVVRSFLLYSERRGPMLADSVTYRTLFSVFAGVLLGFSVAAIWLADNPVAWQALVDAVNRAIPGLVGPDGIIKTSQIEAPPGVTIAGAISVIVLVGAAIGAIATLRLAIRSIADFAQDDGFFLWVYLRNLLIALGIGAALAASAAITFFGSAGLSIVGQWLGLAEDDALLQFGTRTLALVVVFALDAAVIAVLFLVLSGVKPSARSLWSGSLLGAVGLIVLQQLSSLFVGGADSNPLLATFASLIALLLWFNLSAQVILIACAYIVTGIEEERDRVRAKFGASTFAQRRVRRAENEVRLAKKELAIARKAEAEERQG